MCGEAAAAEAVDAHLPLLPLHPPVQVTSSVKPALTHQPDITPSEVPRCLLLASRV